MKRKDLPRRHHNNKGTRQIQRGKTREFVKSIARKYNIKYKEKGHD